MAALAVLAAVAAAGVTSEHRSKRQLYPHGLQCPTSVAPADVWVLDDQHVTSTGAVTPVVGAIAATVVSNDTLSFGTFPSALNFHGGYVQGNNVTASSLPQRAMTAEAWVLVEQETRWGGIIGFFQDNGAYEKGWVLTYNDQQQFGFAVASPQLSPYMYSSGQPFQLNTWYHVAGTWDGGTMKLFVDGRLVASAPRSGGSGTIAYPTDILGTKLTIGVYKDANEHFPLLGQVRSAMLYSRALSANEVLANYRLGITEVSCVTPPPPPPPACTDDIQPAYGWVLDSEHISASGAVTPVYGALNGGVSYLVSGDSNTPSFADDPNSMIFNGETYVTVNGASQGNLPQRDITVEAWVLLQENRSRCGFGGIIGYMQDNTNFKKGWALTYRNGQFGFAVASPTLGPYLYGGPQLEYNSWYHVAGSWDGTTMKLYVDGRLAASQPRNGSAIAYPDGRFPPPATALTIGSFKDVNENYPLGGQVRSAMVYNRVVSDSDLLANFKLGSTDLPCAASKAAQATCAGGVAVPDNGWVLDPSHVSAATGIVSPMYGSLPGVIVDNQSVTYASVPKALEFNGRTMIEMRGATQHTLPRRDITAEAWVMLNHSIRWGGIVGYIQDNGAYEKGFVLTYNHQQFGWTVSSPRLEPYLYGGPNITLNTWYHVAGTWDGQTMKLFVNGTLAASADRPGSAIQYPDAQFPPPATLLTVGQYLDANEHYPLIGEVRSVNLYSTALSADAIKSRYQAGPAAVPCRMGAPGSAASVVKIAAIAGVVAVVIVLALVATACRGRSGKGHAAVSHTKHTHNGLSVSADGAVAGSSTNGLDDDDSDDDGDDEDDDASLI